MAAASALLHRYGALLICDEVQTGLGRTGRLFSYEHDSVQPDLVTLAKTLSGGFVPVGATLGTSTVFQRVYSSMDRMLVHDSTFGTNALAMAAGLATLSVIDDEGLIHNEAPGAGAKPTGGPSGRGRELRTGEPGQRTRSVDRHRIRAAPARGGCAAAGVR